MIAKVHNVLGRLIAGLVKLHPVINYIDTLLIKMFDYIAEGLPVIASNFPQWREIIEENKCGICVDSLDPSPIAQAIDYLVNHPQEAMQMGRNGRRVVVEKYNWNIEKKLIDLYDQIAH